MGGAGGHVKRVSVCAAVRGRALAPVDASWDSSTSKIEESLYVAFCEKAV